MENSLLYQCIETYLSDCRWLSKYVNIVSWKFLKLAHSCGNILILQIATQFPSGHLNVRLTQTPRIIPSQGSNLIIAHWAEQMIDRICRVIPFQTHSTVCLRCFTYYGRQKECLKYFTSCESDDLIWSDEIMTTNYTAPWYLLVRRSFIQRSSAYTTPRYRIFSFSQRLTSPSSHNGSRTNVWNSAIKYNYPSDNYRDQRS